jgi:heterodisulfide reductase subunit A
MRLGEADETGRRRPVPLEGEFVEIEVQQVILAISQLPDLDFLVKDKDFDLTTWATLQADPETCQTGKNRVFACGDAVRGPSTVVEAMASGRRAAMGVDLFLQGRDLGILRRKDHRPQDLPALDDVRHPERPTQPRAPIRLNPAAGISLKEVELAFTADEAMREAGRCFACGGCSDCRLCAEACGVGAIDHHQKDSVREFQVGTIVVATGFELFDCRQIARYGYGRLSNVINALEFERLSHASGPTGGKILTSKDKPPESVAVIHCVGSRDENHQQYCSRVCCMYSLKFAHLVREKTGAEVFNLYIDMRTPGKGYEEFYKRVLREGVHFIRGKCAEVTDVAESPEEEGKLIVIGEDTLLGITRRLPVDMVILSPAMKPAPSSDEIARLLSLSCSQGSFFLEKHPKLAPVEAATDGLFLAGACQGPKDIPDSVAQGAAAAACALSLMDRGKVVLEPITAEIDSEFCSGCKMCLAACPYDAIVYDEEKKVSVVQEELCKGCGTCVATCPSGVPRQRGFTDAQIHAEMEGLLA